MISAATVNEVKRLLAQGDLSQRDVARIAGVGRSTVANIAAGRWVNRPAPHASDDVWLPRPNGSPMRCPTCGGRVYMPCLACHVRELKARRHRRMRETTCAST